MSRIGKKPIPIPQGVTVERVEGGLRVKGPKGTLSEHLPQELGIVIEDGQVTFERPDDRKESRARQGLARSLVANMVRGVVEPWVKELQIQGVGYRADVSGKTLTLLLGFSHPVEIQVPDGIAVAADRSGLLRVEGIDRQQVGQFAADLRSIRPPEPYKGKGVRYADEQVRRKVGKAGAGSGG